MKLAIKPQHSAAKPLNSGERLQPLSRVRSVLVRQSPRIAAMTAVTIYHNPH